MPNGDALKRSRCALRNCARRVPSAASATAVSTYCCGVPATRSSRPTLACSAAELRLIETGDGFVMLALLFLCIADVVIANCTVGFDGERLPAVCDRSIKIAQPITHHAQIGMRIRRAGIEPCRLRKSLFRTSVRILQTAHLPEQQLRADVGARLADDLAQGILRGGISPGTRVLLRQRELLLDIFAHGIVEKEG